MSISKRNKLILTTIIKEYVKTAVPVSSGVLVENYNLGVSPATVRNEMMELEEAGYIFQPHTSAGRVPTELAYQLYTDELLDQKKMKKHLENQTKILDKVWQKDEAGYKQTAKLLAELSQGAIFWAFHKNDLYYTGISNLFAQAEFKQIDLVCNVSTVIDRLEEMIDQIFNQIPLGQQVFIGSQNPFGNFLSTILVKYNYQNQSGIVGILGPMRMDYEKNLALANYLKSKLL